MHSKLSKLVFAELRKCLLTHLGLNFSGKQEKELIQKIGLAAKEFGFKDTPEFVQWLLKNDVTNQQLGVLASYLTVGETYFLREKKNFEFLEQVYIPGLIQKKNKKDKSLRIWSAGCASGEEAYSIAIIILKSITNIKDWNITILATDINPVLLKKAEKGIYSEWSFRDNPDWFKSKYFKKIGEQKYLITEEVKKMVTFAPLNLAKDIYPSILNNTSNQDIIFCRNVLIYFSNKGIRAVTNKLYQSLSSGGVLIVSPVEMSNLISPKFSKCDYQGHTIYVKGTFKDSPKRIFDKQLQELAEKLKSKKFITKENKISIEEIRIPELKIEHKKHSNYEQAAELFNQGLFKETEEVLTDILINEKENKKQIFTLLARAKANLGKLDEAKEFCFKGLEIDNSDYSLYYLIATIKLEQGKDEEAIALLKRAIYLDHNFVLGHFLLGNLNLKKGLNKLGKKHFNNAIHILSNLDQEGVVPESDGLTVGRFTEIITAIKT